jgi:hypothetical protein
MVAHRRSLVRSVVLRCATVAQRQEWQSAVSFCIKDARSLMASRRRSVEVAYDPAKKAAMMRQSSLERMAVRTRARMQPLSMPQSIASSRGLGSETGRDSPPPPPPQAGDGMFVDDISLDVGDTPRSEVTTHVYCDVSSCGRLAGIGIQQPPATEQRN